MKKIVVFIFALISLIACVKEENFMPVSADDDIFWVSFDETSKVEMQGCKVLWQKGDKISINGYEYEALESGTTVAFQAVKDAVPVSSTYVAVYPSTMSSLKISGTTITGSLPAVQTPKKGSVHPSLNYSVAKSTVRGTLYFKNILSYFKVSLGENLPLYSNKINVTTDQIIAGSFSVNYSGDLPVVTPTGTMKLAQLQQTAVLDPGDYYIVTLPRTVGSLQVNFINGTYNVFNKKVVKELVLARNEMRNLGILNNFGDSYVLSHEFYVKNTNASTTSNGQSWSTAVTLGRALTLATTPGDVIYIGAGAYGPSTRLTGGSTDADRTFEIKNNIKIVGGFPLYPNNGTTINDYDPIANVTRLDVTSFTDYHACTVTAAKNNNEKVILKGLTFRGGKASGSGSITVNGEAIKKDYGGGLYVGNSNVEVVDCVFKENSGTNAAGFMASPNANVSFYNCLFCNNTVTSNGGAAISEGTSSFANCEFRENTAGSQGGAVYLKTSGNAYFANCNLHSNTSVHGGSAVYAYGSGTKVALVSSTVTNNVVTSASSTNYYGAARQISSAKFYLYNTIVSGNTMTGKAETNANFYGSATSNKNSINGAAVYTGSGETLSGSSYSALNMLMYREPDSEHLTGIYTQVGNNNPAVSNGMNNSELSSAASSFFSTEILYQDQWGNARTDAKKVIGAYVSGDPTDPENPDLVNFAAGKFYRFSATAQTGYTDTFPISTYTDGVKLTDETVVVSPDASNAVAWTGKSSVSILLDLGTARSVRQFRIHALYDGTNFLYPSSVAVNVKSGSSTSYTKVGTLSFSSTASASWATISFDEVEASMLKIDITSANTAKSFMIDEIQVFGRFVEDPKYVPSSGAYHGAFNNSTSFKDDTSVSPKYSACPVDAFEQKVGKKTSMMLWYQAMVDGRKFAEINVAQTNYACVNYGSNFRFFMYGFLPQITAKEIAEGALDTYLKSYFTDMKTYQHRERGPLFIRVANEMNGSWTKYSLDPANYVKAWRRIYNIAEKCGVAHFNVWVWSPNSIDSERDGNKMAYYYPGDIYVDWVGVSCYPPSLQISKYSANESLRYPYELLKEVTAVAPHKPFMISEGGYSSDYGQPTAYQDVAKYYKSDHSLFVTQWFGLNDKFNIKAVVWENHIGDGAGDRRIHTDATALELYKTKVQSSYWLDQIPAEIKSEITRRVND